MTNSLLSLSLLLLAAPQDYASISGLSVTFAPGVTERQISVEAVLDLMSEGDEQFQAVLTSPTAQTSIGQDTATVVITDQTVTVEFERTSYSAREDGVTVQFTVVKRGEISRDVSVLFSTADGTARGKYESLTPLDERLHLLRVDTS